MREALMASLNSITRELVFKVVFCGPGMGGKTTTLEKLHAAAPPEARGQLVSLATASDRTLYFDYLPLRLPKTRGLHVRLQLFTVPGQVHYAATRKLVLTGSDGVVFVADAQRARVEANVESLEDLESNLLELGRSLAAMPHVMQWNKMDLAAGVTASELEARFNRHHAPSFETVASEGRGVSSVLDAIARVTVDHYWSSVPAASTTQKVQLAPEPAGIASAVRDWAEGTGASGVASDVGVGTLGSLGVSERDLDVVPLSPRKRSSLAPGALRSGRASSLPRAPAQATEAARDHGPASLAEQRFSLAELFPEDERTDVRGIEELVARGDTRGAVLACDVLVGRALARIAPRADRGTAWLLAGLDAGNYRAFRARVESAQRGEAVAKDATLSCVVWAAAAALAAR
jgi:signal recognition particle receptor subunit beta